MTRARKFDGSPTRRGLEARLGFIAGMALFSMLTGCQQSAEVHYRVTVNILDGVVVRSDSRVWSFALTCGLQGGYHPQIRGEAVSVDLGPRGRLFALLAGRSNSGLPTSYDDMGQLPEALFGDIARGRVGMPPIHKSRTDDLRAIKAQIGATRVLPCVQPSKYADHCPFMVRFDDLADVTSVRPIDPANLAESFGPGVSLKDVTVRITDDPVTEARTSAQPNYGDTPGFGRWFATLAVNGPRRVGPEKFRRGGQR